jgi:hypothetical protein
MIPTVLKTKKANSFRLAFKKSVKYVGRDDDEARAKDQLPLTGESCGVFNLDADCDTSEDRELIWQIMGGDAAMATRYKGNPVYHFDVSWMEGEHPTREQLEQAARRFIDGLGFGQCQTFWAVHRDTDNDHLHIVVNKVIVDPEDGTYTVVEKPRFDYRELARIARQVEMQQGWEHAPGYYVVVEPQPGLKKIMTMKEAVGRKLWNEEWQEQKKSVAQPAVSNSIWVRNLFRLGSGKNRHAFYVLSSSGRLAAQPANHKRIGAQSAPSLLDLTTVVPPCLAQWARGNQE